MLYVVRITNSAPKSYPSDHCGTGRAYSQKGRNIVHRALSFFVVDPPMFRSVITMRNFNQCSTAEQLGITGWARDKCETVTSIPWVDNVDINIASAEAFGHERRAEEYVKSIWTLGIVTTSFSFSLAPEKHRPKQRSRSLEKCSVQRLFLWLYCSVYLVSGHNTISPSRRGKRKQRLTDGFYLDSCCR